MAYRVLLIAAALNGAVFGPLFVVAPDFAIALFGGRLDALSSLLVRQFGGVILGIAIFDWLLRGVEEPAVRRAVVTANATAFAVVAAAAAYGAIAGIANALAWVVAAFHGVVGIGLVVSYVTTASGPAREAAAT